MLKDNGKSKKKIKETVRCSNCGKKNDMQELIDTDRIVKLAGCTIITCMYCEEEFQE